MGAGRRDAEVSVRSPDGPPADPLDQRGHRLRPDRPGEAALDAEGRAGAGRSGGDDGGGVLRRPALYLPLPGVSGMADPGGVAAVRATWGRACPHDTAAEPETGPIGPNDLRPGDRGKASEPGRTRSVGSPIRAVLVDWPSDHGEQ